MNTSNFKHIIGYHWLDNVLTGFLLGGLSIAVFQYAQIEYYHVDSFTADNSIFYIPFLKRSLLGGLVIFLLFNSLNKLYAMRGVLLAVIIFGIYLVKMMFFS